MASTLGEEAPKTTKLWTVIAASSAGTLIEWYDFYIFGSLTAILATKFFPDGDKLIGMLSTLALFATGFIVRPFGALVFGRLGDLVGRKYAFLVTLIMMGVATFMIGLVPTYAQIGAAAPLCVLVLRLVQGLALGGEYGGAATYVAEHSPADKRGYYTSFIQTTATLGLLASIVVIVGGQAQMGKAAFEDWGWRVPFWLSAVFVVFSYIVRRKMQESPLFVEMKAQGKVSKHPWRDSFGERKNLKLVLIALFGATAGQGVVWYTGQFYALLYLQNELKVEKLTANLVVAAALVLATPLFVLFGALSDRVGRKAIILSGMALAVLGTIPLFSMMRGLADFSTKEVISRVADGPTKPTRAKADDAALGVKKGGDYFESKFKLAYRDGSSAVEVVKEVPPTQAMGIPRSVTTVQDKIPTQETNVLLCGVVFALVTFVTMVYGPIAAFLVELFPTRIRYSSLSLPYHLGNGVFGGMVPLIATWMVATTANPLGGLYYPVGVAAVTLVVGFVFLKDRHGMSLSEE